MTMKKLLFISFVSILSVIQVTSTVENVALRKSAMQSSTFSSYGATNAVDGNRDQNLYSNSCSHTENSPYMTQVWWRVNLLKTYSITTVAITNRHWAIEDGASSAERLAGFSIYISYTTNWWDGVLCYQYNKTTLPDTSATLYISCYQSTSGQYVTIYNDRNSSITYPSSYSKSSYLELCEVEIEIPSPCLHCLKTTYPYCELRKNVFQCFHGCEKDFFGESCTVACVCPENGPCYSNGTCIRCEVGYYPSGTQCVPCHSSCGGNKSCSISGNCLSCDSGTFKLGAICANCPSNCKGVIPECNTLDGTCTQGCKDGYYGRICDGTCMPNCEKCDNSHTCLKCIHGHFGLNCNNICDSCQDLSCDGGGVCTKACVNGRHGKTCSLNCSDKCLDNTCDQNTANCTTGCVSSRYGPHCNQSCPKDCGGDSKSCNRRSGACETCINGKFGEHCSLNCSSFCGGSKACDLRTGHCLYACAATMRGPFCDKQIGSEPGVPIAALGGGIAAAVVVIIIIIVVILSLKRRKPQKQSNTSYSQTAYIPGKDDNVYLNVGYSSESGTNSRETIVTTTNGGYNDSKPKTPPKVEKDSKNMAKGDIPEDNTGYYNSSNDYYNTGNVIGGISCEDFKTYVTSKIADESLTQEFDSIPYGELYPATVGKTDVNKEKNRFKTTFPYDKTRVVLTQSGNTSDYINANYINGRNAEKKYIATQGPLKNTIVDFWTMVWQCNVGKIVMLTGLIEGGKNKCKKYWPDVNKREKHGRFSLSIIDERIYSYYTQREIKLEDNKSKQTRRVHHFHFTAWPDHDVTDPVLLVQFHKRVESKKPDLDGPLLVHCSAGIGRTGTYIGLDDLVHTAKETNRINVKDFVKLMRECRMNMVQKSPQYVLLHEAILEELQLPETTITMSEFPAEWSKIVSDKNPINQQRIRKEFEKLNEMKRIYAKKDFSASTIEQNKRKSRSHASLALDKYRPYLMKHIQGRTDYINAVIIPSHTAVTGYIVTQTPLKDTVIDIWRLIHDHKITAIVNFDSDHKDKCEFFPRQNHEINNDLFCIRCMSESKYDENIYERVLNCSVKDNEKEKTLKLVSVGLGASKVPSCIQLIKIASLVSNWQHGNNTGPCAVVSCDGTKSCDVFCAVMIAMESLSVDNEVNIFQIVHQLQLRRPEFFADCDTYKLCYEVINQHLTSENIYFN